MPVLVGVGVVVVFVWDGCGDSDPLVCREVSGRKAIYVQGGLQCGSFSRVFAGSTLSLDLLWPFFPLTVVLAALIAPSFVHAFVRSGNKPLTVPATFCPYGRSPMDQNGCGRVRCAVGSARMDRTFIAVVPVAVVVMV